jgi:hypothetical protein
MKVRSILCGCLMALGVAPPAAAADSSPPPQLVGAELVAFSAGFRLQGTNGYTIGFSAFSERLDGRGEAHFVVHRRDRRAGAAFYTAPALVSPDFIKADFGPFGRVDLAIRPSGPPRMIHVGCSKQKYLFEPMVYEGTVEFEGERRYTAVTETQARPSSAVSFCGTGGGYGESRGAGERGARLNGVSFEHGRKLSFQVNKNHPKGKVKYSAEIRERRDGVSIYRVLEGYADAGAFSFADDLSTASLDPPSPFSGSALLTRSLESVFPTWRGDLAIDFVGRPNVRLAGPTVHVGIAHACFQVSGDSSYAASC